jgi:hypothetical protein
MAVDGYTIVFLRCRRFVGGLEIWMEEVWLMIEVSKTVGSKAELYTSQLTSQTALPISVISRQSQKHNMIIEFLFTARTFYQL